MRNNALRGWWKPWIWSMRSWILAICLAVIVSPLVTRWICLWQVSDVVLPFHVEDVLQDDLPDDQNAYVVYANVLKMIENPIDTSRISNNQPSKPNSELTRNEILQRVFTYDENALAEFIRAGKMERAAGPTLKTTTFWTDLEFQQHFRQFARTFSPLGIALEANGEFEKAWTCHLALLQCSIHAEQPRLAICTLIGIAVRSMCGEGIVHWASNPAISSEQLKAARADISREYARRLPTFDMFKGEYLTCRNSLAHLQLVDFLLPNANDAPSSTPLLIGKRAFLWSFGQPELARRMYAQILLNNSTELDKPLHLRRHAMARNGSFVFDLDPNARHVSGQLDAEQLFRAWDSNAPLFRISKSLAPAMANLDQARLRDNARFAALTVLFAAHEFQRTRGEFPESIEQLAPTYLDVIPFDPLDAEGSAMKYKREPDGTAIVWSVGPNGIDDHGAVIANGNLDIGYQIKLNHED